MDDILTELQNHILLITLNRVAKHNAFDDVLLTTLQSILDKASINPEVQVIILKANGCHFSAGADLIWMQRMAEFTEAENLADAMILSRVMYTLYHSKKPTIAMVHGGAYGGGAGLAAACDIVIAAHSARFCFSEVKLGLIPAVISPYVIKAIGERAAACLFMSAETIDAKRASALQLVHYCVPDEELLTYTLTYAKKITQWPTEAVRDAKALVRLVANQPIDDKLQQTTAALIAKKRVSSEGQQGIQAFLNKGG